MILAGIDEAGYGPLLGPLVVGSSAFEIADRQGEELPCLWTRLKKNLSKRKTPGGRKLHVNDSKIVYSPSAGLKELERSVLAIAATLHGPCENLNKLIQQTAAHAMADLRNYSWYQPPANEPFPFEHEAVSIAINANALAMEMRQQGIACVHLAARVMCERQFNTMLAATRNKASALFSVTAIHLDYLLRNFEHRDLTIVCDRQGGREHYGSLLRLMFDEWTLEITRESGGDAEYRLNRNGYTVRLVFWEKSESRCLPVAAAAMLSKYLRETLMSRFNAFWLKHVPLTNPTAGYYTDGLRFLRDIEPKRKELGISDGELIRCR